MIPTYFNFKRIIFDILSHFWQKPFRTNLERKKEERKVIEKQLENVWTDEKERERETIM